MAKVAKIVWASVGTRVIVDENATDEQVWETAKDNLVRNLASDGLDNGDKIVLDTECPYGTLGCEN
jgi:hypothetical protein